MGTMTPNGGEDHMARDLTEQELAWLEAAVDAALRVHRWRMAMWSFVAAACGAVLGLSVAWSSA